jgi:hypothetical protein
VSNWTATVPLQPGANNFSIVGLDVNGQVIAGASNSVSVNYGGTTQTPVDAVVINEIMFDPAVPDAEYVELFNTSSNYTFDLSGWDFNGVGYEFPAGSFIAPRSYLLLAKDPTAFNTAYGSGFTIFDNFSGNLQANGETLSLLKPGPLTNQMTVVDRVRYEPGSPWPVGTNHAALQLRDPAQDNSRIANWAMGSANTSTPQTISLLAYTNAWKFMAVSNLDGVNWTASAFDDSVWPSGPGLLAFENNAAIAPLILTPLAAPGVATNNAAAGHAYYFRIKLNLTKALTVPTVNVSAYIDDGAVLYVNGAEAIRVRMATGTVTNLSFATNQPPGGDAINPDTFSLPSSLFGVGTNTIAVEVHQNVPGSSDITFGLQMSATSITSSNAVALTTPGGSNSVAAVLPPFPKIWLNEVQPDNLTGPVDNFSQREPWVEVYNAGNSSLSFAGYLLSDNYTNLSKWSFPSNASVIPGGFFTVWCDNETNQTAPGVPHANFRLTSGSGQLALSRIISGTNQILDYLTYTNLPANWSYGDLPDGQPFYRGNMFFVTPGGTNNGASPPITIFINEWMADNTQSLADPADGNFEDWFELYNPGTNAVDVGGYYLTDNLTNKTKFLIPANGHYVVAPGGYLLVWADDEANQNNTNRTDLHAAFALSKSGEALGLFAADGTQIDAITFGAQTTDVSQGRFPDGASAIYSMPSTPRAANALPNTPPILDFISNKVITLGQTVAFTAGASDSDVPAQSLTFSLGAGAPAGATITPFTGSFSWKPNSTGTNVPVSVVVTDNGTPNLSATQTFFVTILIPPTISVQVNGNQMQLSWPRGTLQEADNVTGPYLDVTTISPITVDLTEFRKFYRIRL